MRPSTALAETDRDVIPRISRSTTRRRQGTGRASPALALGLLAACGLAGGLAWAQEEAGPAVALEQMVVTGSYIKKSGSEEDGALPIEVIDELDLERLGAPSAIELVRNLGVTAANLGETNQFAAYSEAYEGLATVNLRGLGAARTLVLVNGRRQVGSQLVGVDINAFPVSALGRLELLKDGAAAIYGSDAISGVANFITREDFQGLEIGGSYQAIDGSSGDHNVHFIWGRSGDAWNFMLAGELGKRGQLEARDRDWALVNTDQNTPGGWSGIGHPGADRWTHQLKTGQTVMVAYHTSDGTPRTQAVAVTATRANQNFSDTETCERLGALRAVPRGCGFHYLPFDNIIEDTETSKVFGSFNRTFGAGHRLHVEGLWSEYELPALHTSPSLPPQSLYGADRRIPDRHPGWLDYKEWLDGRFNPINAPDMDPEKQNHPGSLTPATVLGALNLPDVLPTGYISSGEMQPELAVQPGLADDDEAQRARIAAALSTGEILEQYAVNRAMGVTGAFGTGEAEMSRRTSRTARIALGLDGSLAGGRLDYDIGLAWSRRERETTNQDMYVERMALALQGFGGPRCKLPEVEQNAMGEWVRKDEEEPHEGAGEGDCEYYNPYSRAIERSYVSGLVNPGYAREKPEVHNSEALLRWLIGEDHLTETVNELLALQGVVSGETGWTLPGGKASFAAGLQVRDEQYDIKYNEVSNRVLHPCPFREPFSVALGLVTEAKRSPKSPMDNPQGCTDTGLKAFLSGGADFAAERTIYSVFGELALPILAKLDMQVALRYEDYGGAVGASIDPKVAISYRATDKVSVRGSVSTTFRGPPQSILDDRTTSLQFIAPTLAFKAIDNHGNPHLNPEKAVSANIGVVYQTGPLYASLDWWGFTLEDSFQVESFNGIITAYDDKDCPNLMAADPDTAPADCQRLAEHLNQEAHTDLSAIRTISTQWLNGEDIATSGLDFKLRYDFEGILSGAIGLTLEGTYLVEYKADAQLTRDGVELRPSEDLAGRLNEGRGDSFTSKPQLQASLTASYEAGTHYASLVARHVSAYDDLAADTATYPHLAEIDAHLTLDAHYQFTGWAHFSIGLAILNLTDRDPPQARGDLSYDPFTHNPSGRMVKLNLTYRK